MNTPPGTMRAAAAALLLAVLASGCGQRVAAPAGASALSDAPVAGTPTLAPASAVQRFSWQQLAEEVHAHFLAERGREPQSPRALLEWLQNTTPATSAGAEERAFWARRAGAALGAALVRDAGGTWLSDGQGATATAAVQLPDGRVASVERFAREVAAGTSRQSLAAYHAQLLAPPSGADKGK